MGAPLDGPNPTPGWAVPGVGIVTGVPDADGAFVCGCGFRASPNGFFIVWFGPGTGSGGALRDQRN